MADEGAGAAGDKAALGIWTVAAATALNPRSSEADKALARRVLDQAGPKRGEPREAEGMISAWNRELDVVLDAANASADSMGRADRRAQMAAALDRAGLCLVDQSTLADLLSDRIAPAPSAAPPWSGDVAIACAAECQAAGGAHVHEFLEPGEPASPNVND